jgi:hypothetical protein
MTSYHKSRKNRKTRRNTSRKSVRRQRGGELQSNEQIKTDIKNALLNKYRFDQKNENGKFPAGKYTVHIQYLSDSPTNATDSNRPFNRNKICHHYSLFSLIDALQTNSTKCCGEESSMFRTIDAACKDGGSCTIKSVHNIGLPTKKVKVRFYSLPLSLARKHEPISQARNHSARYEQLAGDTEERWWHKFGGTNALISIDGLEDIGYNKIKEFTLDAYEVPSAVCKPTAIEEMTVTFSGVATIV